MGLSAALFSCSAPTYASIPEIAKSHQRQLTREARAVWGLDAPVSTFAAQVHQESRWQSGVRSPVGAQGLGQFMPDTTRWIARVYPHSLGEAAPFNPDWALRALVTYDHWLYQRIEAATECDRWAFVLSAYNGGLGWVQRDRKKAGLSGVDNTRYWGHTERVNAGRGAAYFSENRTYPARILQHWQPQYEAAGWGMGVCHD